MTNPFKSLEELEIQIKLEADAQQDPMAKICFDGVLRRLQIVELPPDHDGNGDVAIQNVASSPLERLYHQNRNPIEPYQYMAGIHFREDYARSQVAPMRAIDAENGAMYDTDAARQHRNEMASRTFRPKGAKSHKRSHNITDGKIDAQRRLGVLYNNISHMSYVLLEHIVGKEISVRSMAASLGMDNRYVAMRVREALTEAAGHYRLCPTATDQVGRLRGMVQAMRHFENLDAPDWHDMPSDGRERAVQRRKASGG